MYPKIGQNIVLHLSNRSQSCKSLVADIGADEISIAIPMSSGMAGLLPIHTKVAITFLCNGNKYEFHTTILGRTKDQVPLFRLAKPQENEIIKIQLRENFRVKASLPVILDGIEHITVNISVGGLLFSCSNELLPESNKEVSGKLLLLKGLDKDPERIEFMSEVIRVIPLPEEEKSLVALKFTAIDKKEQSSLLQYCFEKQRQMRMTARKA